MKFDFGGKMAIVTGGGSGIGRQLAERLAAAGAFAVIADRSNEALLPASAWQGICNARLDVCDEAACSDLVARAAAVTGRLDILVNCAGVSERGLRTVDQATSEWQKIIDVNLGGTYRMSKAAAVAMSQQDTGGSIVNVGSVTGLRAFRASNGYGVSKSAVAMLTQTMASDLASCGVRVNAVAPGFVETPMTADLNTVGRGLKADYVRRIPMRRFGSTDEVAGPVLMLCSDLASYMTGAVIPVDGGWTAFDGVS